MNRYLVLIILIIFAFSIMGLSNGGHVGVSSGYEYTVFEDGKTNESYFFTASSSAWSIIAALLFFVFIAYFRRAESQVMEANLTGLLRRAIAVFIDLLALLLIISPIATVPVLLREGFYRGEFHWYFSRNFFRDGDFQLIIIILLVMFVFMLLYYWITMFLNKQTIGQYIMRLKIVFDEGEHTKKNISLRVFLFSIGTCLWILTAIIGLFSKEKKLWYEGYTGSRTRKVEYQKT